MNYSGNQPYSPPPAPAGTCRNCGAALSPGHAFCPSCGTPTSAATPTPTPAMPQAGKCPSCNAPLTGGTAFCPHCGSPVTPTFIPPVAPQFLQCSKCGTTLPGNAAFCSKCGSNELVFPTGINPKTGKKKSKASKVFRTLLIIFLVIVLALVVIPAIHVTPEEMMEEGNYIEAYQSVDSTYEKDEILAENVIAVLSAETSDGLKNPDSFELREAYYYPFLHGDGALGSYAILYVSGTNSYGGRVSSYWAYTLDNSREWNFLGTCYSYYDQDGDELSDMLAKIVVRAGIEKGSELDYEQVDRINQLFEDGLLGSVDAIDWDIVDTSNFTQD